MTGERAERPAGLRSWGVRLAGPLLIALSVLIVMHGFWLGNRLTSQQVDIMAFWLPRWCFLGRALAHGHLPTWLPNQFGGVPFASDPQSAWTYLPAMLLFSTLSCTRALELFITLQPLLAGLGLYWFFRHEGVGRPAATAGGLTLALTIAGSAIAVSLPFAGMLAWTAMALAGASGYLHARKPTGYLGWLAFTGISFSQVMGAQLTDGLLIALTIVGAYAVARSLAQIRSGERRTLPAVLLLVALFAAVPLLSAATLYPRLALLPRTSIGRGYVELAHLANQLSGTRGQPALYTAGVGGWWGTSFARGPGGYVGALGILLIPLALASRRWRASALAFAALGVTGLVLNLDVVVSSNPIRSFALHNSLGTLWLHSPYRFRYLLPVAFAGLAGYGLQAWLDRGGAPNGRALARRALWLVPSAVLFALLPIIAGSDPGQSILFGVGVAYGVPLLLAATRGVRWAPAVLVALLAVELCAAGLAAQGGPVPLSRGVSNLEQIPDQGLGRSFPKFHAPYVDPSAYLHPGAIGSALIEARDRGDPARYLSLPHGQARWDLRGVLPRQLEGTWPAYQNGRSVLFDLDEIQGYSPVQVDRYWQLVRRVAVYPIYYNAATFQVLSPQVVRLFGVEWVIAFERSDAPAGASLVAAEGVWRLYRLGRAEPRASLVHTVRVAPSRQALEEVIAPSFDPAETAVVEENTTCCPGTSPSGGLEPVSYRELSPERIQVTLTARAPGMLVVRNAYDRNWRATVDGRPARLMVADFMMQGVLVPAGHHVVELRYRDSAVGIGLAASGLGWAALILAWAWLRHRQRSAEDDLEVTEDQRIEGSAPAPAPVAQDRPEPP
jgi:hypothetical protein